MPSAFAHAAVGASLSCLLPRRAWQPWIAGVLAVLAAAPDLDVVAFRLDIPYAHPLGHRGLSHSLFFAGVVGLLSLTLWRRVLPERASWLAAITALAVASHGLLDTLTDAGLGIGLLLPFDDTRYFAPWRPILTSPLSVGGFFSARGLAIVTDELFWVGLPCGAFVAVVLAVRALHDRHRHRKASSP